MYAPIIIQAVKEPSLLVVLLPSETQKIQKALGQIIATKQNLEIKERAVYFLEKLSSYKVTVFTRSERQIINELLLTGLDTHSANL